MRDLLHIYNPLPGALNHYARALDLALEGLPFHTVAAAGIEVGSRRGRLTALTGHVRVLTASPNAPMLDLWPGLGHWEVVALAARRGTSAVVIHDPDPLRAGVGYGSKARRYGVRVSGRVTVVAHSRAAFERLADMGYQNISHVPLPILPIREPASPRLPVIRVIGQYKRERDTRILEAIAPLLARQGFKAEILGRGWPPVAGWTVRSEFLDEPAFDRALAEATAVIIPYKRYWQSDVAIRALEHGTPVVGAAEGFLGEVFGPSWPGLVESGLEIDAAAWSGAVVEAAHLTFKQVAGAHRAYADAAHDGLRSVAIGLSLPGASC